MIRSRIDSIPMDYLPQGDYLFQVEISGNEDCRPHF